MSVAEFAERFDLAVEDVPGTTRILDALVEGGRGDDFRPELFGEHDTA